MFNKAGIAALTAMVLTLPAIATAQPYYGSAQPYEPGFYAQPRGDYEGSWRGRFSGYPEFRGLKDHIRREIQSGLRNGLMDPEDARDLFGQLRDIQQQETREFQVHGWNLPAGDRYRLRSQLQRLDSEVDEMRDDAGD